jgi:hypothetical protein
VFPGDHTGRSGARDDDDHHHHHHHHRGSVDGHRRDETAG